VPEDPPNPFRNEACPGLHAAWEEGFQAYLSGRAVPERHLKSPSESSNAWLNGYTAARLSGEPSAQTGPASLE
jgi:ribosome modulation factor